MREKILQLIALTTSGGISASIGEKIQQLRDQWVRLFQEAKLSPGVEDAFNTIEAAMRDAQPRLEDAVIGVYEKTLTEEEVDAAIAYYSAPIAQRLGEVGPKLMEEILGVENAWMREVLADRNAELAQLLGEAPAATAPPAVMPAMEDLTPDIEEPPTAA